MAWFCLFGCLFLLILFTGVDVFLVKQPPLLIKIYLIWVSDSGKNDYGWSQFQVSFGHIVYYSSLSEVSTDVNQEVIVTDE